MYTIKTLQTRLEQVPNLRQIAKVSGLSEKTIYRVKNGYSSVTVNTANLILKALDSQSKANSSKRKMHLKPACTEAQ